jgi:hypothetical protein
VASERCVVVDVVRNRRGPRLLVTSQVRTFLVAGSSLARHLHSASALPRGIVAEPQRIKGVLAPDITPIKADHSPDAARLIRHCSTTSEANSFSVNERLALLDALVGGGVDPTRMMPGTGCCALSDSIQLTEQAVQLGCAGVLMLPPFYYKDVSDEGLHRYYAEVVQRIGDARLRIWDAAAQQEALNRLRKTLATYPMTVIRRGVRRPIAAPSYVNG